MKNSRRTWVGFGIGFVAGLGDYLLLRTFDVTMFANDADVTFLVVLFFALNFGALGAVIARLWERGRELSEMQGELVEAQTLAAVGQMAAGVAHEVRNPLSTIRSSAQLLEEDLGEQDGAAARFIREEVDRLDGFVTRVLDFSRPLDARRQQVPVEELQARLVPVVGDGVTWAHGTSTLDVDTDLTVQLLANLVENARRADAARIEIRTEAGLIEVVDDGSGVAEHARHRVFEPFFTTRASGTGLGLAMARKLARVQGWELELAGDGLGPAGACFRLTQRGPQ